jgi:hypothetical protein
MRRELAEEIVVCRHRRVQSPLFPIWNIAWRTVAGRQKNRSESNCEFWQRSRFQICKADWALVCWASFVIQLFTWKIRFSH